MNKEELYELALSDVHKYNLLNEIFAIKDERKMINQLDYAICVNGFISLNVLNQYVNKVDENINLKQRIDKAIEYCNFGIKEWTTDDRFVEEVLKDIKAILKGYNK